MADDKDKRHEMNYSFQLPQLDKEIYFTLKKLKAEWKLSAHGVIQKLIVDAGKATFPEVKED